MGVTTTNQGQIYDHSLEVDANHIFPKSVNVFSDLDCLFTPDGGKFISRMERAEAEAMFETLWRQRGTVLDIGTRHGGSAIVLAASMPEAKIISVDIQSQIPKPVQAWLAKSDIGARIKFLKRSSRVPFLDNVFSSIVFDGDHTRNGVIKDIETNWNGLRDEGYAIFHDVYVPALDKEGDLVSKQQLNKFQIAITPLVNRLILLGIADKIRVEGELVVLKKRGLISSNSLSDLWEAIE